MVRGLSQSITVSHLCGLSQSHTVSHCVTLPDTACETAGDCETEAKH